MKKANRLKSRGTNTARTHDSGLPAGLVNGSVPVGAASGQDARGLGWWLRPIHVASFIVLLLAAMPIGPFAFLPPVVAVPIVVAVLLMTLHRPGTPEYAGLLPRRATLAIEVAVVVWTLAAYMIFKVAGLHPSGTDDNIYFYMAKRFSEGAVPYRDFFFAHPPVHLLVPAAVFGVGGYSIGLAKMIPVAAQMIAAACLYLAIRPASRTIALVAVVLHLFAYQVLMGSTDMNGENLMTAFLAASLLASTRRLHVLAGGLAGLALGCGLYALAGVLALGFVTTAAGRRDGMKFLLGVAASFGALCLVFRIIGGDAFWDGVVTYHLNKAVRDADKVPVFAGANPFAWLAALVRNLVSFLSDRDTAKWLYYHLPVVLASIVALLVLALPTLAALSKNTLRASRGGNRRILGPANLAALGLVAAALFIVQWAALAETYDFYLVPMWFFLAIPAAYGVAWAWTGLGTAAWNRSLALPSLACGLLLLHPLGGLGLSNGLWPEESAAPGEVVTYEWREPWTLASLGPVSKALFFKDNRVRGTDEPPWRHALWNKLLTFSTVRDIASVIKDAGPPDETLSGASTLAPLVALEAGRRLAADEADTNGKRFRTGMLTDLAFARRICADRVRWLVAAPRSHFEPKRLESDPLWSRLFERYREFEDSQLLHRRGFPIVLFRLKDGATLPDGTPCGRIAEVIP